MGALIVQHTEFSGRIPNDDNRLARDPRAKEVSDVLHLAFVADIDPGGSEDAIEFELEDFRVGVEAAVDASGLHKLRERSVWKAPHGSSSFVFAKA